MGNQSIDLNTINGVIRAVVPAIMAYVVGHGWIGQGAVSDITAAALALAAAGWSIHTNRPPQVVMQAATVPDVEKIIAPTMASLPNSKIVSK